MENSLYVGLSSQVAVEAKMALIANNVANINTPGYRGQNALFKEYISDPPKMKADTSLVYNYGQYQVNTPGPVKDTGSPLDVALIGPGFIGVQTPNGIQYTRAGNLSLNAAGEIITSSGYNVADQGGGKIVIPQDAKYISIDDKGTVSTDAGAISNIMVSEFKDYQKLDPQGNGLYKTDEQPTPTSGDTVVKQGKLEGANVSPILEMTRMIDVTREYAAVQRVMQSEHDRMTGAISRMLASK